MEKASRFPKYAYRTTSVHIPLNSELPEGCIGVSPAFKTVKALKAACGKNTDYQKIERRDQNDAEEVSVQASAES